MSNKKIINRNASFNYHLVESFRTGIILLGSEIKSIRNGDVSIKESYCYVKNGEIWIKNMYVKTLTEPLRERKLLLKKSEIRKIIVELQDKGKTIIPVSIDIGNLIKVNISIAKGKKNYDKRESIKLRDLNREKDLAD